MEADRIQHICLKLPIPATGEWLEKLEQLVTDFVGSGVVVEREITPATTRWLGSYLLEPVEIAQRRRKNREKRR